MARIRSVKPALRTSRVVASWPIPARYAWVLLWGYLDDYGRGIDDVRLIVADLFPLDRDITEKKMETWLRLWASTINPEKPPALCRYEVAGETYLHAVNWHEHQHPNRPTPSVIPPCPTHARLTESRTEPDTKQLSESSLLEGEGEKERGGGGRNRRPLRERPDPWCTRHPGGTDIPCRPCASARRDSETWTPPPPPSLAELAAAPRCEAHGEVVGRCPLCRIAGTA